MTTISAILNPAAITRELGDRLRRTRLRLNLTQKILAGRSGLSVGTIKALESGHGTLDSLVRVLSALSMLDALDTFLPDSGVSPMETLKLKGRERQRASHSRD